MDRPWKEPSAEIIPWPELLAADEDEEKEFSGLLEEE